MDKLLNATMHFGQPVTPQVDSTIFLLQLLPARHVCQQHFVEKPHVLTCAAFALGQCFIKKKQHVP